MWISERIKDRWKVFGTPVFLLLAFAYFSINTLFMPHGLSLVLLFGMAALPFVLFAEKALRAVALYLITFFIISKLTGEINSIYYAKSSFLFLSFLGLFFLLSNFLRRQSSLGSLMELLTIFSLLFLGLYLVLWFSPAKDLIWWRFAISTSLGEFTRLRGFTYEPSYYALTLVPLVIYQFSRFLTEPISKSNLFFLGGLAVALVFSFSLGVLLGLTICFVISLLYFIHSEKILQTARAKILTILILAISGLVLMGLFFPGSPLLVRLSDLFSGKDTSGNSRLYESFLLSFKILDVKRLFFGLGVGQFKVEGFYPVKNFYHYNFLDSWGPIMPNSATDWMVHLGVFGLGTKLFFEIYLFFKTRVFDDVFRFCCFVFIFIYQFTGGFLVCLPELVLWSLAFFSPNMFLFPVEKIGTAKAFDQVKSTDSPNEIDSKIQNQNPSI